MSTLIIGASCSDGVVLAADRKELRGFEPTERTKVNKISIRVGRRRPAVLLAGAGIAAFWDEVMWSLLRLIEGEDGAKAKTLLDIIDRISYLSIQLSARYQRDGLDDRLGCVVAGLQGITSGKPELYHFSGAGFSKTDFVCLGSGDRYALLPVADLLLHQRRSSTDEAVPLLSWLFRVEERVNPSVGGGPDIFVLRDDRQAVQVPNHRIERIMSRICALDAEMSGESVRIGGNPWAVEEAGREQRGRDNPRSD